MNPHIETLKEWLEESEKGHAAILRGMDNEPEEWIRAAAKIALPRSQAHIEALTAAIADMERIELVTTYLQVGGDPRLIVSSLTTFPNGDKKVKYIIEWEFIKDVLEENSDAVAAMKGAE